MLLAVTSVCHSQLPVCAISSCQCVSLACSHHAVCAIGSHQCVPLVVTSVCHWQLPVCAIGSHQKCVPLTVASVFKICQQHKPQQFSSFSSLGLNKHNQAVSTRPEMESASWSSCWAASHHAAVGMAPWYNVLATAWWQQQLQGLHISPTDTVKKQSNRSNFTEAKLQLLWL